MNNEFQPHIGAVLTGDIVNSLKYDLETRNIIRERLSNITSSLHEKYPYLPKVKIFQGDSWQLYIKNPSQALEICLIIRGRLRALMRNNSFDTRVSIGLGQSYIINKSESFEDGEAFICSGRGLVTLSKEEHKKMLIGFGENILLMKDTKDGIKNTILLLDFIVSKWTFKQAYSITEFLLGKTTTEISKDWIEKSINRRSISKHLVKSGVYQIIESIQYFRNTFADL